MFPPGAVVSVFITHLVTPGFCWKLKINFVALRFPASAEPGAAWCCPPSSQVGLHSLPCSWSNLVVDLLHLDLFLCLSASCPPSPRQLQECREGFVLLLR